MQAAKPPAQQPRVATKDAAAGHLYADALDDFKKQVDAQQQRLPAAPTPYPGAPPMAAGFGMMNGVNAGGHVGGGADPTAFSRNFNYQAQLFQLELLRQQQWQQQWHARQQQQQQQLRQPPPPPLAGGAGALPPQPFSWLPAAGALPAAPQFYAQPQAWYPQE